MRKLILFYLVFVFLAINARAQQNTVVTIGTNTTTSSSLGPVIVQFLSPTGYFSRHMALYPATTVLGTPFSERVLTKIAWYKEDTARHITTGGALKVYVKQTSATNLGGFSGANWATDITGAVEVLNLPMPKLTSGSGWKEFTLATPYAWNGTSNLEVFVEWTGSGTIYRDINWRYSPATGNVSATTNLQITNGLPVSNTLPNTQLTFSSFNNDAGITAISSPVSPVTAAVSTPTIVTIKNGGANALTSATIGWNLNGVAQPDYSWTGNLANSQTDAAVNLGNFTYSTGVYKLKAYIKSANGVADPVKLNDTTTVQLVACNALSGNNYTINKNAAASATNFQSFTVLAQILNTCGITGPVTVTVAPNSGPYNESLNLVNVLGTSATNTITIEGNGNTITSPDVAVVKLDRANYVRFNNLVITQANNLVVLSYGVQLFGPSDFVSVTNCTINMPLVFGNNIIGILGGSNVSSSGNHCNNSLFQNNIINGGHYGIRINGLAVTGSKPIGAVNNRILGNQFRNFTNWGVYMGNADGTKVEGNDFSRPNRPDASGFAGVAVGPGSVSCVVNNNSFHNTHGMATGLTTSVIGVQVDATPATGLETIVKNNIFYDLNNQGIIMVFNISGSGVNIYHNTASIDYQGRLASNTSNLKGLNLTSAGNNVNFINNVVTINTPGTGTKAAIWLSSATTTFTSNNNVLYIAPNQTAAFTGYLTTGKLTLADWRLTNTTTPYDVNSVAFNPVYTGLATGNLKPTSPDVDNIGQPSPVTDDILGMTRSTTTPDPGAYEFILGSNDAGISAITSPTSPAVPGVATPIIVTLKNLGTATLTSASIGWKVDGVVQPTFAWSGSLTGNQTATGLTIGNYTFTTGNHTICAWTKFPNGVADANAANDSTCFAMSACLPMAGNYTINKNNPTSTTNFASFTAAADRLHSCGVSAKVTITVVSGSGPYTEQVALLNIPGANAANFVVFQGNGNTLTATPTAQKNTVLKLDNADFVKFNNLNITLVGTGVISNTVFSAVQMVNHSDNDTISNCTITMPYTTATNDYFFGIYAGAPGGGIGTPDFDVPGNNTNNSVFLNNTIKGGLYGIKINGNTGGTNAVNNRIIGNSIQDGNSYGISLLNTDGNLVEGNEVKRPTLPNPATLYAISLNGTSKNNRISKNRIVNLWGGSTSSFNPNMNSYGLYFSGTGAPAGSENIVSNNIINDTNTPGTSYGIYNLGNSGVYYYHNTISNSNAGTAYGFYQLNFASNVKLINNNISIVTTASSNNYALYFNAPTSMIESNRNNLFVGSAVGAFVGFYGTANYTTLADWKTANSGAYDQNSVAANPLFVNPATGNFTPVNSVLNNISQPVAAVTTDITGATRNATTPDPGAYEFEPVQNDVAVVAVVSPTSNCNLTNQETVTITIKNFAAATQTSIPVSYKADAGPVVNATWTGTLPFNATVNYTFATKADLSALGPHTILAKTILAGDAQTANDDTTVTVTNFAQVNVAQVYNFEAAATGLTALRTVTRTNSNITDGAGASFGTSSTKGLILDGVDNVNWVAPAGLIDPWTTNPENFSAAYICFNPAGGTVSDSLWMTFDLKQLFKGANANTNFRVTVNGQQIGSTFRPPFTGTPINWQKVKVDLTAFKNLSAFQVGLESSVKEAYANATGTANLLDNIEFKRHLVLPTGVKENSLAAQVSVFPNPSNGKFNVTLPAGKTFELEVTDLTGKVIKKLNTTAANMQLDLTGAKGIYLLRISSTDASTVRKLFVE
jgi:parallel beta-helix repeat protein